MKFRDPVRQGSDSFTGVYVLQNGADLIIRSQADIEPFDIPPSIRRTANERIKALYLSGLDDMRECEAAAVKLAVFYQAAQELGREDYRKAFGQGLLRLRDLTGDEIRPMVSAEVRQITGH